MKGLILVATVFIANSNLASARTSVDTAVTIYNTSSGGAEQSTIVLRQAKQKINLISCWRPYEGAANDAVAAKKFYDDAFKTINGNVYCYNLDNEVRYFYSKKKIEGEDNQVRYVYTENGLSSKATSDGSLGNGFSTYTVDANDDYGQDSSNDDVLLMSAFIMHTKLENPVINTERVTYKLAGRSMIKLPEMK
ncbi:hypothetical protein SHI21_02995 [Bacteriovorax sp. PP10]|uniref:Uncharacterized protein n=1 Tax=Bacteriovorax antarcticus TaxID=3088717 RepID=A0ABU5VQ29_9BACT|nr:hypothetical protein [Bacteriovorax sp. PP10]MEA9355147.1 hypothetical protein [Bacteriovorax sp. PP10]